MGVIGQTILPWWSTKLNLYYFDFRFFISNIDIYPFIKYLLGTILEVYKDFGNRFSLVETKLSALEMVRKASMYKIGRFNKQDIRGLCTSLSNSSIEKVFRDFISLGEIKLGFSEEAKQYWIEKSHEVFKPRRLMEEEKNS